MATVLSSKSDKHACLRSYGEEPPAHVESGGDRLIKELSKRQAQTNFSVDEVLSNQKEFTRGSGVANIGAHSKGTASLSEFRQQVAAAERECQLWDRGVTRQDVVQSMSAKAEPSALDTRKAEIIERLQTTERTHVVKLRASRHERELGLAVKPGSDETRLLEFALSCQAGQTDSLPAHHPINQLPSLVDQLFNAAPLQLAKTLKRKRKQQLNALQPPQGPVLSVREKKRPSSSLWDLTEPVKLDSVAVTSCPANIVEKAYGCQIRKKFTITDGKVVEVKRQTEVCPKQKVEENNIPGQPFIFLDNNQMSSPKMLPRLTEEEIRQLPRFKEYKKGDPSQTLYVKNLPSNMKNSDLAELFGRFQKQNKSQIVYRLLTGRMRGQAFVTFHCMEDARDALDNVNGTLLKGNPVIVQFGRKSSEPTDHRFK